MHKTMGHHCLKYKKLTGELSKSQSLVLTSWPRFGLIRR